MKTIKEKEIDNCEDKDDKVQATWVNSSTEVFGVGRRLFGEI